MRFARLDLLRYGIFTDKVLQFRPDAQLHLIYGPNEAGKSSSLAAIGDLLFGFARQRQFDFVHDASALRVGAEIVSRRGERLNFRRRRGLKNTLLSNNDEEAALQDDVLAPFIGNIARDVFSRAFGLNSETLRRGGAAMLESEGELGTALFAAASGLTGLARIRREIDDEADSIFAPRTSKERAFYQALDRYDTAITAERRNELKSGDWRALIGELEDIEGQLEAVRAQRIDIQSSLARLQRLKLLQPLLLAIDQLSDELESFVDLPEVPEGFIFQCATALGAVESADGRERLAEEEVAAAAAGVDAIALDEAFLERADDIVELFSRKGDYLSKLNEMPRLTAEQGEFEAALADLAQRLGLGSAEEVLASLPPDAVLQQARELIERGKSLEATLASDEKHLADEVSALEKQEAAGSAGGLVDPKPWRDQMAALAPDLELLAEQAYLEGSHRALLQKLAETGRRMSPPVDDVGQIAQAVLPTRETVAVHKASFDRLLAERQAETVRLEGILKQHHEAEELLVEAEQVGPLADQDAVALARTDRDTTFAELRSHLERTGLLLSPEEVTAKVVQFEEEMLQADRLADEAVIDADRLSRLASYRERLDDLDRQRLGIEGHLNDLEVEQNRLIGDYNELFERAGLKPIGPDAMASWLSAFEDLLNIRREAEGIEARMANLVRLNREVHAALLGVARSIGSQGADEMPVLALSRLINSTLEEMASRWNEALTSEGARQATRIRVTQLRDHLTRTRQEHKDWRLEFDQLLPALGLEPRATAMAAAAALNVWASVPELSRERASRVSRLQLAATDVEIFESAVTSLAEDIAPVLADLPPQGLIDVLRQRAENARGSKVRRDDAMARLQLAEIKSAQARSDRDGAVMSLQALATLLPEGSDIRAELGRLSRREALRGQLDERRREFELRAEGFPEAEIRYELASFHGTSARFEAEDLERRGNLLSAENDRLHARLGQKQLQREALEEGTGAELAAFERRSAEAEIVVQARQWAVRRIAGSMLGSAIERHRESQSDPLLLRAGNLFRTLTSGSFARLVQDYGEDDLPSLAGVRKGGERVAIGGMSEGTRDQLYLALRLAYIEDYASRAEPLPFIGDDIFQTFDDERTEAGIRAFASTAVVFQPILFTHHASVVEIGRRALGDDLDLIEL